MIALLVACTSSSDDPTDRKDDGGPTETGTPTGETGDTGPDVPVSCDDPDWLPGAYWLVEISVHPGPSEMATDLALLPTGEPVVLVNALDAGTLSLLWRDPADDPYALERALAWEGLDGRAPIGRVLGVAPDGAAWVGGHLADGAPFAARFDLATAEVSGWALAEGLADAEVTAGPVFTDAGAWLLGTVRDPAVGERELVLWRIDDAVHEVFRWSPLADGDTDGAIVAGALAATGDGRVLLGGGVIPSPPAEARAVLFLGDDAGFVEALSLPASATSGVAGAVRGAAVKGDALAFAWGAAAATSPAEPSWIVYEGPLADPIAAVAVDTDAATEHATPLDLRMHPSGAVFVGGTWVPETGALPVPYVRLGVEGAWTTNFAPKGFLPGWVSSVEMDPGGDAWGLCLYSEDGIHADAIEILHLNCRL